MENKIKVFTLRNFREIPQIKKFVSSQGKHAIEVVGNVLPFKVNNYVIDELINWDNIPEDPVYQLTFPQKDMLSAINFRKMEIAILRGVEKHQIKAIANEIRYSLNPHPENQTKNIPEYNGIKLKGVQHKYRETVLFFPSSSQTCHAYCTFCFRWPQFVGLDELKFMMQEASQVAGYLNEYPYVTDILFTGGDPMVMSAKKFEAYIDPIINHNVPHLKTIRIGTKSLSYWPYRYLTDRDADDMLRIFEKIVKQGYHLALMAHINHKQELQTKAVKEAIRRIRNTGAIIRTQSPILKHINDDANVWSDMWKEQVNLGMIPYYMFVARDTGSHDYFAMPLVKSREIFNEAYKQISGIVRTVRGPVMSTDPGKIQILGVSNVMGQKVFVLSFIQGRNPNWVGKTFFAEYNPEACWLDELKPAFGREQFFFEEEIQELNKYLN